MTASDMKNIHFLVPRPLYEEFRTAFPEVGLMKILFTQFMQAAIEGAEKKDSFVKEIYENWLQKSDEGQEEDFTWEDEDYY